MRMKLEAAWLQDFAKRYTGAWCSQSASSMAARFLLTRNAMEPLFGLSVAGAAPTVLKFFVALVPSPYPSLPPRVGGLG
jgi:hypothetical protein